MNLFTNIYITVLREFSVDIMNYNNVILINPYSPCAKGINDTIIYPPLGLLYIASYLRKHGIGCSIIDAKVHKMSDRIVLDMIKNDNPELVGIYTNIISAQAGMRLSNLIKEKTGAKVVIGGPYASSMPKKTLQDSHADCVVLGEGEITFYDLTMKFNLKKIRGIGYLDKGSLVKNPGREMINNLDAIPFPDYDDIVSLSFYSCRYRKKPVAPIITSRGCPFLCINCNKNIFGNKFRARSPQNVVSEIEYLVRHFGVKQIDILDDNFSYDLKRAEKIFDLIIRKNIDVAIHLQNGIRADCISEKLVIKMKRAGVFKVALGVESADTTVLKILGKQLDLGKVQQAIRWFKNEGIITTGLFILGLPGDTRKSIEKTISFAKNSDLDTANFALAMPLPGTELEKKVILLKKDKEKMINFNTGFFAKRAYFELEDLSSKDIAKYQKRAYMLFYRGRILRLLNSIKSLDEFTWVVKSVFNVFRNIY